MECQQRPTWIPPSRRGGIRGLGSLPRACPNVIIPLHFTRVSCINMYGHIRRVINATMGKGWGDMAIGVPRAVRIAVMSGVAALIYLAIAFWHPLGASAQATACVVTSTQDPVEVGKMTLRDAIDLANTGDCTDNNTITFGGIAFPPGTPETIALTTRSVRPDLLRRTDDDRWHRPHGDRGRWRHDGHLRGRTRMSRRRSSP